LGQLIPGSGARAAEKGFIAALPGSIKRDNLLVEDAGPGVP
jgi:hypothetical protein